MWKTIQINNSLYLINWKREPVHTFLLSDLKELWSEEVETDEMHRRFNELNPLINSRSVQYDLKFLSNAISSSTVKIQHVENRMLVDVEAVDDVYPLRFKWELNKKSNDMFFKEITLNLISSVITLEKRQDELFSLLMKKDKEKCEYVREYGEISRDFLKTVKFDKEEFIGESSNSGMCGIFSYQPVVDDLKSTYGMKLEKRKADPVDDKQAKKVKQYIPKFLKRPTTK
nr:uncharacterized protein LOC111428520 [Onthophagus taurus]